jgi:hypothetical protein
LNPEKLEPREDNPMPYERIVARNPRSRLVLALVFAFALIACDTQKAPTTATEDAIWDAGNWDAPTSIWK